MKILESIFFGQLSGETLNNKYSSTLLSIEEDIWSKFSVAALSVEEKEKLYKAIDYDESVRLKYPTEVMLLWCFIISLHPLYVSNYCIPHLLYFQYAPLLFPSFAPLPVSLSLFFVTSSPFLMVFLLSTYLLPSLSSLPLLLYHHYIFLHHVLPTFPPLLFFFTPVSFSVPSLLLLFLFLHPFSSPCPSSHLFFNHVLQIPPSLIHFLHAISPPPLRLTPPPSPHSLFIHSSSSSFSPFFSSSLLFPLFSPFFSFLFLPFFYFHPLLLSQSWSLYLIHQSSKPVMI